MSISVTLAPEVEQRLHREASLHGSTLDAYIREIVEKAVMTVSTNFATPEPPLESQLQRNASTIALLEKWRVEGEAAWAQMTPEERDQEEADWDALRNALNENRRWPGDSGSLLP